MAVREPIEGSWGIDPVPERLRVPGPLDTGLLVSFAIAGAVAVVSRCTSEGAQAT